MIKKAQVRNVFIDKKALRAGDAAAHQSNEVLVMNVIDQVHFIKEMFDPLSRVKNEPLYCNRLPIRQNSLIQKRLKKKNFLQIKRITSKEIRRAAGKITL